LLLDLNDASPASPKYQAPFISYKDRKAFSSSGFVYLVLAVSPDSGLQSFEKACKERDIKTAEVYVGSRFSKSKICSKRSMLILAT